MEDEVLILYYEEKLRQIDISKQLHIPQYKITRIIQKDSRYKKEKEIRHKQNKNKNIEYTKEYNKSKRKIKQFKNNADDLILKNMHNQASAELSKTKRLSNMAYRNWNKSAYSYNEKNKRFEFKNELGRSFDVPKYIKVEVL